ncbi:MAG: potassium-transporting ATPase subunit C [Clostridiales bacterium]|nr:potassium-transporting ATPase subunit C [Clostridiales bacterium]
MSEQKNGFLSEVRHSVTVTLTLLLICGLLFPVALSGLSAVLFPHQAAGSLVEVNGQAVGAENVGQDFTKPYFMKCRPSAYQYNTYYEGEDGELYYNDGTPFAGLSSGSNNYGPSNPALAERVAADLEEFLAANPGVKEEDIPTDLLTASGSGLDPHVSPEAAAIQLPAISQASGLSMDTLKQIVANNTQGKLLGIFGAETVNVLGVNVEIARAMGMIEE